MSELQSPTPCAGRLGGCRVLVVTLLLAGFYLRVPRFYPCFFPCANQVGRVNSAALASV